MRFFTSLTLLILCAVSSATPRRTVGASWKTTNSEGISTPHGFQDSVFDDLVRTLFGDPRYEKVEAFALFGSRTHHDYGNLPDEDADFDIHLFVSKWHSRNFGYSDGTGLREWVFEPLKQLKNVVPFYYLSPREKGGFHCKAIIVPTNKRFLDDPRFERKMTPRKERRLYAQANQNRDAYIEKLCAYQLLNGREPSMVYNRQTLILLKNENTSPTITNELRQLGYSNLLFAR